MKKRNNELVLLRARVERIRRTYTEALSTLRRERSRTRDLDRKLLSLTKAVTILQTVSELVQEETDQRINKVVTACLKLVFPEEGYEFKIKIEKKRKKTEARPILIKEGQEIEDPVEEDSGGVVEVASFALQFSCMLLVRPAIRKVLLLDEPFKSVSIEYRSNVRSMLDWLEEEFHTQIILVTHMDDLALGKTVWLHAKGGARVRASEGHTGKDKHTRPIKAS